MKYPRTPYLPFSPSIQNNDKTHQNVNFFMGKPVVITEKIDGSNTFFHGGKVYARSTTEPSRDKWFAMVKKHHAWKVPGSDTFLYGEDIFGVHSIEYDPVEENSTFYAFGLRKNNVFLSFDDLTQYTNKAGIKQVPVEHTGVFHCVYDLKEFFKQSMKKPSELGGKKEGLVIRIADKFSVGEFDKNVAKYVRANHVQTDSHWRYNWKICKLK